MDEWFGFVLARGRAAGGASTAGWLCGSTCAVYRAPLEPVSWLRTSGSGVGSDCASGLGDPARRGPGRSRPARTRARCMRVRRRRRRARRQMRGRPPGVAAEHVVEEGVQRRTGVGLGRPGWIGRCLRGRPSTRDALILALTPTVSRSSAGRRHWACSAALAPYVDEGGFVAAPGAVRVPRAGARTAGPVRRRLVRAALGVVGHQLFEPPRPSLARRHDLGDTQFRGDLADLFLGLGRVGHGLVVPLALGAREGWRVARTSASLPSRSSEAATGEGASSVSPVCFWPPSVTENRPWASKRNSACRGSPCSSEPPRSAATGSRRAPRRPSGRRRRRRPGLVGVRRPRCAVAGGRTPRRGRGGNGGP